ncbi:MAG: trypsin-like serine protease [Polyangiales bacterium]
MKQYRAWIAVGAVLSACAADETSKVVEDPVAEGLLRPDWLGFEMGVAPPTFVDEGKVEVTTDSKQLDVPAKEAPPSAPFDHGDPDAYDVTDLRTGHHYSVTLGAELARVAEARATRLRAEQPAGQAPTGSTTPKVIADFFDTRIRASTEDGYSESSYYAAIGDFREDAGCTGVLISRDVYLTAAHCVTTPSGNLVERDFYPRQDRDVSHWGEWTATHVEVPKAWLRNNCTAREPFEPECAQYDVALVRVTRDAYLGEGHSWWFRVAAETHSEIHGRALRNYGYPNCGLPESPPSCEPHVLYGDRNDCALGDDFNATAEHAPVTEHSCDTSKGQSGSPVFYWDDAGKPVLVGLHVGGSPAGAYPTPNWLRRFTPNTLNWIHALL